MKILACLKSVPDKESRLAIREDQKWIREEGLSFEMNESDLYALEEGLRLKEKHGGEVVVLSLGDDQASKVLKSGLAMGADRAIHIKDESFRGSDLYTTAKIISRAIKKGDTFDLILAGVQSDDLGAGQIGIIIAELLDLPHSSMVVGLEAHPEQRSARVTRELEAGLLEIVDLPLPAVLAIQFGINQPRYASLKGIMQAKKKDMKVWGCSDLDLKPEEVGAAASQLETAKVFFPEQKAKVEFIEGATPEEKAERLLEKLHKEAKVL